MKFLCQTNFNRKNDLWKEVSEDWRIFFYIVIAEDAQFNALLLSYGLLCKLGFNMCFTVDFVFLKTINIMFNSK